MPEYEPSTPPRTGVFEVAGLERASDGDLVALRAAFERAGFDERCLNACEAIAPRQLDAVRVPAVLHELRGRDDDAATLTIALIYGGAVVAEALARALGREGFAFFDRADALVFDGERVRVRVRVMPFRGLWIASDDFYDIDPVMGPGITTDELAHTLAFDGMQSVLDVGCGAGSLALFARRCGVRSVVGTDIDPRAIAYSRFNGRLNGLDCEWHIGDLGAPALGRRFDGVVSQPAYVAQPDAISQVTFLHGGARGDELALRLVSQLDALVGPTGRAWILFDTPRTHARDVAKAVHLALGSSRFDVCVAATPGNNAADQSIAYASLRDRALGDVYAESYAAYRRHFERLGVEQVRHVLVHARAREGATSVLAVEPASLLGFTGEHLERLLESVRWSAAADGVLRAAAVRPNRAARLVHEQSLVDAERVRLSIRFDRGAGVDQEVSDTAAVLLTCIRDHQPLDAAIDAYAEQIETTPQDVMAQTLAFVRQGLRSGLLVVDTPAEGDPSLR